MDVATLHRPRDDGWDIDDEVEKVEDLLLSAAMVMVTMMMVVVVGIERE